MADVISLATKNRSPKQPIKRLPASVEVPANATVEDVKKIVARQSGIADFNRVGLFDPETKKNIKDRVAPITSIESVSSSREVLVKDLGPQMSWRLVYQIEYLGPILFHGLWISLRHLVSKNAAQNPLTLVQWLIFCLFQLHFFKREIETIFVHRFSANTMPAWFLFRNSFFYWTVAGLVCSFCIYQPGSPAARDSLGLVDFAGLALFFFGEIGNGIVHLHLKSLRKPGTTTRGIPTCIGSSLVTCPNYMFEVIAWIGVIFISRDWSVVVFIMIGTYFMRQWSRGKEQALREAHGDKYKNKRYTMFPGVF